TRFGKVDTCRINCVLRHIRFSSCRHPRGLHSRLSSDRSLATSPDDSTSLLGFLLTDCSRHSFQPLGQLLSLCSLVALPFSQVLQDRSSSLSIVEFLKLRLSIGCSLC